MVNLVTCRSARSTLRLAMWPVARVCSHSSTLFHGMEGAALHLCSLGVQWDVSSLGLLGGWGVRTASARQRGFLQSFPGGSSLNHSTGN